VLWCKAPISHRLIQNVLPAQLQQMLHAGDVTTALETLGVKGQDSKTLVEAVTANLRKELDRLERTYEFKAGLEYSSEAAKQTALANLTEKINKTKDSIKGIEERIAAIGTEMCPICYDDPAEPLVTPCCSRAFCAACLLMSMTRNPECPMCRAKIHPSACTKFVKEGNTIVEAAAAAEEAPEGELLGKEETLLRLMRQNPEGRFLIFSRYDNPFEGIERRVTELGVVVRQLKGNKDAIAGTLKAFDGGSVRCLLLNSRFAGSGLNITAATHVVLLHAMTHEEEKQILGRAYRMGRKGVLNFVKLLNKGEESYVEGN
jgi:SNF2 family DNA or RNA helicase